MFSNKTRRCCFCDSSEEKDGLKWILMFLSDLTEYPVKFIVYHLF